MRLTQPTVLQDGYCLRRFRRSLIMALRPSSSPVTVDEARRTPPQFFKVATGSESSGDEFGVLEDERCIDTGVFQRRYLVHELVFACSPPPSGPLRAGPPPSHPERGDRSPSVLALIGAWNAVPGLWRFRGPNKGAWVVVIGSLAVSLGSLQPFSSSRTVGCVEILGPIHAMEKK